MRKLIAKHIKQYRHILQQYRTPAAKKAISYLRKIAIKFPKQS